MRSRSGPRCRAHGGIQSNFNKILVSICVSTMGGGWTDIETFMVPEKLGLLLHGATQSFRPKVDPLIIIS